MRQQGWIKTSLKARGYKLRDAAERLLISPPRMTDIIKGTREVQSDEVLALSEMLGISPTTLLNSVAAGTLVAEADDDLSDRLEIKGTLTGDGTLDGPPAGLGFRSVPLPPDTQIKEGLSCYVMGDDSMAGEIASGSLIIAADPKRHLFPITPGVLLLVTINEKVFLRRYQRTRDGDHWLVATPREPDPRLQSFRLALNPLDAGPSAAVPGENTGTASSDLVHVDSSHISAGVMWVHRPYRPH